MSSQQIARNTLCNFQLLTDCSNIGIHGIGNVIRIIELSFSMGSWFEDVCYKLGPNLVQSFTIFLSCRIFRMEEGQGLIYFLPLPSLFFSTDCQMAFNISYILACLKSKEKMCILVVALRKDFDFDQLML